MPVLQVVSNPFRHSATLIWNLPESEMVQISIFDLHSKRMAIPLPNTWREQGTYQTKIENLLSGIYLARLQIIKKMRVFDNFCKNRKEC